MQSAIDKIKALQEKYGIGSHDEHHAIEWMTNEVVAILEAEQEKESCEFAEWAGREGWRLIEFNSWIRGNQIKTTSQLFKQSKEKKG